MYTVPHTILLCFPLSTLACPSIPPCLKFPPTSSSSPSIPSFTASAPAAANELAKYPKNRVWEELAVTGGVDVHVLRDAGVLELGRSRVKEELVETEELRELPLGSRGMARGGVFLVLMVGLGGVDFTLGLSSSAGSALTGSGARRL